MTRAILLTLSLFLCGASFAHAAIVGSGNITPNFNDSDADLIAVDLASSLSLAAGDYNVSSFNYQFTQVQAPIGGSVRPFLATLVSGNYRVIALGDTIPYTSPTSFASVPFGGTSAFTLGATTTVYAGFYWDGTLTVNRNPIGGNGTGSTFIRYGGASNPVLNANIGGGAALTDVRRYDFSLTVDPVAAVPEPSTLALAGVGLVGALVMWRKRQ